MKVLKFGGSSVGGPENISKVIDIVMAAKESGRLIVVLSAMQGTTDRLIRAANMAKDGDDGFDEKIEDIAKDHRRTIAELFHDNPPAALSDFIDTIVSELKNLCVGVYLLRELSSRTLDRIVSFGELASSRMVSAMLESKGIANLWLDSRRLIRTNSTFGSASVDMGVTSDQMQAAFGTNTDIFILPGFISSDKSGATTTLGRGGSDYTAAIAAAAVDAKLLEIWTDVSGMMSADPRFVRKVHRIPRITYREAMELSHFGAKVIYPPTIHPVMAKGIPLLIKNTFAPEDEGTLVESESADEKDVIRGITSIDKISVLNLEGSGMVGIPGFSKRLFDALSQAMINVILITQSSSEHSISVAVEERFGDTAKEAVDAEFEQEIAVGKIEPLRVETGLSILALVGDKMKQHTGVSGKMFTTLGQNGINIHAIAQGSSERNISAIINSADVRKAVNTLHEEFFSGGVKQINLYIAGTGNVGRRLLDQIRLQHRYLLENLRLNLRVIGLANSRRLVIQEDGIELDIWEDVMANSEEMPPEQMGSAIIDKNLRNSVFVDVTADPGVVPMYEALLKRSVSIVACNKIAASSSYQSYLELKNTSREFNTNFLFETNVGAGLPVINTLNDLMSSGDEIRRIDAVLSGTLNFVFNNYDGTRSFAEIVRQAQQEGYTEPDPRLDLSGTDVARKILILAREAGYAMELSDIDNDPFLPEACFAGTVEDFYAEMLRQEDHFRRLFDSAAASGRSLKYIATLDDGKASVGLRSIDPDHNFADLSGKDNAVMFYTNRYAIQPLVVKGAGAGADVTAAGVFADIIRTARA